MNYIGTKTIETNRLILRKFKITDSENMFKNWSSDSKVTKYLSWKAHNIIKDSEEIVNIWVSNYDNNNVYNWVSELKETNEAIGSKYWNKGITTEALQNIIDYL